ncbi:MAG: hypothetical protein AAFR97_11345, partial [Bacteroidota bacterium]
SGNYTLRYRLNGSSDCLLEEPIVLNAPNAPAFSLETESPSGCGLSDGSVSVIPPTTGDYEYRLGATGNWQPSPEFPDLEAGVGYEIYIRPIGQLNSCIGQQNILLEQGPLATVVTDVQLPSDCGASDGSILVLAQSPANNEYEYRAIADNQPAGEWSTSESLHDLSPQLYTIQLRMNGDDQCVVEQIIDMYTSTQPGATLIDATEPEFCGDSSGIIIVDAEHIGDYLFSLSDEGPFQEDGQFFNLSAGLVEVYIQSANDASCQGISTFELGQPEPPPFDAELSLPPYCVQGDASISILPVDNDEITAEYRLRYPDGSYSPYQTVLVFDNLDAGSYLIEARYSQNDDCLRSMGLEIPDDGGPFAEWPAIITETANACLDLPASLFIQPANGESIYFSVDGSPWTTQQIWSNLETGFFQIQVALTETGCGAIALDSIELISQDVLVLQPTVSNHPSSCALNDGAIIVQVAGQENANLEYTIDGGESWTSSNEFDDLAAGSYHVGVRHAALDGCEQMAQLTTELIADDQPIINGVEIAQANACTAEAASIIVDADVNNGAELLYSIDGGQNWIGSSNFSPPAGNYTIMVRTADDEPGLCAISWPEEVTIDSVLLGEVPELVVDQLLQPSSCSLADGIISFSALSPGTFEYSIDQGENWQLTGLFENLPAGTYWISVRNS